MIDHYSAIHHIYELFYRKKFGNEKYVFKPSKKFERIINEFIKSLDDRYHIETIGINFLVNYFIFQFQYCDKLDIEVINQRMNFLPMVLGQKSLKRYFERNTDFDFTLEVSQFVNKYDISIAQIKDLFDEHSVHKTNKINRFEEQYKQKFYGTNEGFLNCIQKTTLFNHHSKLCILCTFRKNCLILLRINYPNMYKERGYDR